MLEGELRRLGAHFVDAGPGADHVERDGNLITGQNPASSVSVARAIADALSKRAEH